MYHVTVNSDKCLVPTAKLFASGFIDFYTFSTTGTAEK